MLDNLLTIDDTTRQKCRLAMA